MRPLLTMRAALSDPHVFGATLDGDSWSSWRVLLIAAMGEPLTADERRTFERLTARPHEPGERVDELWCIIGRRGGKTRGAAVLAAYLAALVDWSPILAPGERASLPIMSASLWQARKAKQYLDGIFADVPALRKLVESTTVDSISLRSRVDIECRPASFRTARGGTCVAVIADEVAFWMSDDSKNPDSEIVAAVRPALATTGGPLICISSPYARRGELWGAYERFFGPGKDAAILVAKAPSLLMNPSLSEKVVQRAIDRDAASAAAEYGAEFRTDIESFVSKEAVDAAIDGDAFERPPLSGVQYCAFVDPSGGSADQMTMGIAHTERTGEQETVILDCVRAVSPPFNPDDVTREFAATLKAYGLHRVTGDRYGGQWPAERFKAHGIRYEPSEQPKNAIYQTFLPLLNGGRVRLLDHGKLASQLTALERRTGRGGRDSIDHPPNGHDDVANAAAGAMVLAINEAARRRAHGHARAIDVGAFWGR